MNAKEETLQLRPVFEWREFAEIESHEQLIGLVMDAQKRIKFRKQRWMKAYAMACNGGISIKPILAGDTHVATQDGNTPIKVGGDGGVPGCG